MKLPSDNGFLAASEVIQKLIAGGFRALLAGGCVRDMLLGRTAQDYDVATSATPKDVRRLFPRARMVGAKFGVVLVRRRKHDIEVATFRRDGVYTDGRHPDKITFGGERDDALRRDFTINGMFLDLSSLEVIDHVGGMDDIDAGVVRTIGHPERRFAEDYLRLLRAPRFAARLGFSIEADTRDAIIRLGKNLRYISPERVWMELQQLLTSPSRGRGFGLVHELGLVRHLSGEMILTDKQCELVAKILGVFDAPVIDPALAMAAVLHELSRNVARDVCRSLRMSNRITDDVLWLLSSLEFARRSGTLQLADFKQLMAHRRWDSLLSLLQAKLIAENADLSPYDTLIRRAGMIAPQSVAPPPLLRGDQLIELGADPGPRFGEILKTVYRAQLNEEITTIGDARILAASLLREK